MDGLEAKVKAAQDALRGGYDKFRGEANALNTRLDQVKRMLQWQAEAAFRLLATEGLYAAVEAKWDRDGKDDPRGRLFLADQRLLFERREAVAAKKFLFIATEKEQVRELSTARTAATGRPWSAAPGAATSMGSGPSNSPPLS